MQRRQFLLGILGAGLVAHLSVPAYARSAQAVPAVLLKECLIAGSAYYAFDALLPFLHEGTRLDLCSELNNPHDTRAVEVFLGEEKLGYLPQGENAAAAMLLKQGYFLYAEVGAVLDRREVWEPLLMRVYVQRGGDHESLS